MELSSAPSQKIPLEPIIRLYQSAKIQEIEEASIEMERNGFAIDCNYFDSQKVIAGQDLENCLGNLRSTLVSLGVDSFQPNDIWASPKQLVELLHDKLHLPPSPYWFKGRVDVDGGERKTDRVALEWLLSRCVGPHEPARPIIEGVMELRRIGSSLKYLAKLPKYVGPDGYVHPVCGPAGDEDDRVGAITGRRAMKNPEAHQIPRDKRKDKYGIRKGFIAPPGQVLVVRDYTALEVVILANVFEWLFGDTQLLTMTAPGEDIHAHNAYTVFGRYLDWRTPNGLRIRDFPSQYCYKFDDKHADDYKEELAWYRDAIKAVWYKLQYGGTIHGFSTSLRDQAGNPVGKQRAQEIVYALYEAVPAIPKWQTYISGILRQFGGICALDGRYVSYEHLIAKGNGRKDETDWAFQAAVRGAQNLPPQGTGAHITGVAMVALVESPELKEAGGLLQLEIHDELQCRGPEENAKEIDGIMKEAMEGAFPLKNLRTSGGIGKTWADCK